MHKFLFHKFLCAICFAVLSSSTSFAAQNPAQTGEEIVVTATRTDAPKSTHLGNITAIKTQGAASLFPLELVNRAAGVDIQRGSGQEHLAAIRSPVLVGGAGAGSFLYLEDSIPMRAAGFANVNALLDAIPELAAQVEVVKGPASALYGSNALHGLVNFISDEIKSGSRIETSLGSYGRYQWLGQTAARRAPEQGGGAYRLGIVFAGDEEGYRAASGFEQQKIKLEGEWQSGASDYRFSFSGINLNQETASYITDNACAANARAYEVESCAKANANPEAYRDASATRAHLRINHALENGARLTITPYARANTMEFLMHFLPTAPVEKNAHRGIGTQVNYSFDIPNAQIILGFDFEHNWGSLSEIQEAPARFGYEQGTHYDYTIKALTLAPYIHSVWSLSERLELTAGLRGEYNRYDYKNKTDAGLQGRLFRPNSRSDDFFDLSPKLGLSYSLSARDFFFVNLARGVRAPQTTDLYRRRNDGAGNLPSSIKSETLDSLELGYRLTSRALFYEVNLFAMRKRNHSFRDADDVYVNNGKTSHYGIENTINWQADKAWSVGAQISYALHRYEFNRAISNARQASEAITDGNLVDSAPRLLASAHILWQPSERFRTRLDWRLVGSYYMDAANTTRYRGHRLVDWSASFAPRQNLELGLKVKNLLDTDYAKRADRWFGNNRYFPGEGREWQINLAYKF